MLTLFHSRGLTFIEGRLYALSIYMLKRINRPNWIILHSHIWHDWICIHPLTFCLVLVECEMSWSRGNVIHHEFKARHGNSLFICVVPANLLARSKTGSHETHSWTRTHPPISLNFLKSTHKTHDHCTSSTLLSGRGGAGLSSLHNIWGTNKGAME